MSLLDVLLRKVLQVAGVPLVERASWNIVSGATAVDNPVTKATDITITGSGGGGTPGGSNPPGTQVQFNDGGTFGGTSDFLFNKATGRAYVFGIDTPGLIAPGGDINAGLFTAPTEAGDWTYTDAAQPSLLIEKLRGETSTSSTAPSSVAGVIIGADRLVRVDFLVTWCGGPHGGSASGWATYLREAGAASLVGSIHYDTPQRVDAGDTVTLSLASSTVSVDITAADAADRKWDIELKIQTTLTA